MSSVVYRGGEAVQLTEGAHILPDISPDGSRTTISSFDHFRSVKVARGITGVR